MTDSLLYLGRYIYEFNNQVQENPDKITVLDPSEDLEYDDIHTYPKTIYRLFYIMGIIRIEQLSYKSINFVLDLVPYKKCQQIINAGYGSYIGNELVIRYRKDHVLNQLIYGDIQYKPYLNNYLFMLLMEYDPIMRKKFFDNKGLFFGKDDSIRTYYIQYCTDEEFKYFMVNHFGTELSKSVIDECKSRVKRCQN